MPLKQSVSASQIEATERQLAALFAAELSGMRQLRDILHREYRALVDADVVALEQVTGEKNQVLSRQSELNRQRQEYLDRSGLGAGGLEDFLSTCDNAGQLRDSQQELKVLAQQCHEANRSNGRVIVQKQQHTLGALSILRRSEPCSPTYSGEGNAVDDASNRLLGKA